MCAVKYNVSSMQSPLPPVPCSYNIDVLTVLVFVYVCVCERAAVGLTVPSNPQQDKEAHGGLTSAAACLGGANNCIDLSVDSFPLDSEQLSHTLSNLFISNFCVNFAILFQSVSANIINSSRTHE